MSGRKHRQKGDRIERELVDLMRAIGIKAERYPASGATRFRGSGHDVDCYLFGADEAPAVFEVKARKEGAGFALLRRWLGEFCGLYLRENRQEALFVLPERTMVRLLKELQHAQDGTSATSSDRHPGNGAGRRAGAVPDRIPS